MTRRVPADRLHARLARGRRGAYSRRMRLFPALLLAAAFRLTAFGEPVTQDWLQAELDKTLAAHDLIALGAAVAETGSAPVTAVTGETRKGSGTPASAAHAWHLGSNTKALTALLYARLVEDGLAEWGATLPELFPGLAETMDPAWRETRIEDILAHRSGLGGLGPLWLIARRADDRPLPRQRYDTVKTRLAKPPEGDPGTFEYSNLNYLVAGAAIERLLDLSWEEAVEAYVLEAEGANWSQGWGFGPPQDGLQGHSSNLLGWRTPAGRGSDADNPLALGPAATAHAPLGSHARLLLEFVDEESPLVTPAMRARLLMPWPDDTANYSMGWGIIRHDTLGRLYAHGGSNTMWLSRAVLVPGRDTVVIVNASEFTGASREATDKLMGKILDRLAGTGTGTGTGED